MNPDHVMACWMASLMNDEVAVALMGLGTNYEELYRQRDAIVESVEAECKRRGYPFIDADDGGFYSLPKAKVA